MRKQKTVILNRNNISQFSLYFLINQTNEVLVKRILSKTFHRPQTFKHQCIQFCGNWQQAKDDWSVASSEVSTGVSLNNVKWLKKEILVLQMSFSLQFPTGEEWFPLPVSLISIIKCCVFVLVLSALEFLASAVRADASRSEAEPACCAVTIHTDSSSWPTCWPLQKSIPQGPGYNKSASLSLWSCFGNSSGLHFHVCSHSNREKYLIRYFKNC